MSFTKDKINEDMNKKCPPMVLNLGCGNKTMEHAVNVDIRPFKGVDVIHDLNHFPWPFKSDRFLVVFAQDVFEHLDDIPKAMMELYRICDHGAAVYIRVPRAGYPTHYTDPTHKRGFGRRSFDYFDSTSSLYRYGYGSVEGLRNVPGWRDRHLPNLDFRVEQVGKEGYIVPANLCFMLRVNKVWELGKPNWKRELKTRLLDLWDWWVR